MIYLLGCESTGRRTDAEKLPLPEVAALACCWQSLERLDVTIDGNQMMLSSATAVTKDKLTVVILDPLGRRWMTITQRNGEIEIDQSPEVNVKLPVKWLILGIYLRNMTGNDWRFPGSNWVVERRGEQRLLKLGSKVQIRLIEDNKNSENQYDSLVELRYLELNLVVKITTLSRQFL
ncbi:MAG: DUF3261 domain-containing protein [Porticoccus sp.]|nr:DUF3261 domain-containing protein [Porticoccus sp.]MBQ0806895.1 DUF3261 domain-containing protein [Porticoccus sp.]